MTYDINKETHEAIMAGEQALRSLRNAKSQLDSARTWGMFDMLGGGFITGMMKRSKMRGSQDFMRRAKYDLDRFADELHDVQVSGMDLNIEIDDFLGFADLLWDNFFVDWMMQDRINNARYKIDEIIHKTEHILRSLKGSYR